MVFLIGGCSGVGKTRVAPLVAQRLNASVYQVDDFRMALQSITNSQQHPELHYFISSPGRAKKGIWNSPPDILCEALIKVGSIVSSALEVVVAHHIKTGDSIVLEGDGIIPEMVSRCISSSNNPENQVNSVFIYEPDQDFFLRVVGGQAQEHRSDQGKQRLTIIQMHWLYNQWLIKEATKHSLLLIAARPWDTLADRILLA
ncbi:hypothetical protein ES703_87438 [subsurface metagenome]